MPGRQLQHIEANAARLFDGILAQQFRARSTSGDSGRPARGPQCAGRHFAAPRRPQPAAATAKAPIAEHQTLSSIPSDKMDPRKDKTLPTSTIACSPCF